MIPRLRLTSPWLLVPVLLALTVASVALWTAVASVILLLRLHWLWNVTWPEALWTWWRYYPQSAAYPVIGQSGWLAAEITAAVVFVWSVWVGSRLWGRSVRPLAWRRRPVLVGSSDNHGHARWQTLREALRLFPGPANGYGGVVVGEAYRVDNERGGFNPADRSTWGKGGTAPLLIDPCTDGPTHSLIFAGSGQFKTVSAASTIIHWTGSSVILDPSCELGPMLTEALTDQGKRVHILDPADDACGFNALAWIDVHDPLAEMHVRTTIARVFGDPPRGQSDGDNFFRSWGLKLVVCLTAHLLWDENRTAPATLATVKQGAATPEDQMRDLLRAIHQDSASHMARSIAGQLMGLVPETFSGIYASANEGTGWLDTPAFAQLVSGDAFAATDILNGRTTVFVQIPLDALIETPGVARVIIGSLLNAAYQADGAMTGRVLFLLDEAARLGRMKILQTALATSRKFAITIQALYQSLGQIEEQWGTAARREFFNSVSWIGFASVFDLETAKYLSECCGTHPVLAYSEGDNAGSQGGGSSFLGSRSRGRVTNVHEIARPLIRPEEIMQARADEMFVIARNRQPLRCGRAIYFRRPELVAQINQSRFVA